MTGQKLKALLTEYGRVALATYFGIFFLVLLGFALAIAFGVEPDGWTSSAGVIGGAYLATKLTQPIRIAATLVVTPLVARVLRRFRRRETDASPNPPPLP